MNPTMLSEIGTRLGWTLLHSLWQLIVLAFVLLIVRRYFCNGSAHARYFAGCTCLALMSAVVPLTFATIETPDRDVPQVMEAEIATGLVIANTDTGLSTANSANGSMPAEIPLATNVASPAVVNSEATSRDHHSELVPTAPGPAGIEATHAMVAAEWTSQIGRLVDRWVALLPIAWITGAMVLSLRPILGWFHARRLRRFGCRAVESQIRGMSDQLCRRLGIRQAVSVVESTLVDVPTVIGELRPLVLLPASALTGLTPEQLQAVIAHELAHVRRHDYLVNCLQTVAETILFYHPALWWVSRQVRIDREECCDDIAMVMTGDRAGYANMLVTLDTLRGQPTPARLSAIHAMSSGGGSLVSRIRRIVQTPAPTQGTGSLLMFSLLLLAFTFTVGSLMLPASVDLMAQDRPRTPAPFEPSREPVEPSREATEPDEKTGDPLELRILANPPDGQGEPRVSEEQLRLYRRQLETGQFKTSSSDRFQWFPIAEEPDPEQDPNAKPGAGADSPTTASRRTRLPIEGLWRGRRYTLACNQPEFMVAWADFNQHLQSANLLAGNGDDPQIEITFDHELRKQVTRMTSNNLENRLAIIVNGTIVSTPRIQSIIHQSARITGRFSNQAARRLHAALLQAVASDDQPRPLCLPSNASPAFADATVAADEQWFRPKPFARPHQDLRNGKGYWFVQIAANPKALADLQLTDRQRQAIDDVQQLYQRGGPERLVAKTSLQRQQLWMQARQAAEALMNEAQIKRVEQLMIQRAGADAFRDPVIIMALNMTDEQREKINAEFDTYRHLLVANQTRFEQVEILSLTGGSQAPPGRLATIRQLKLRRDQLALRQLWANIRQILTRDQRRIFDDMRGPMTAAMRKELSRLEESFGSAVRFNPSVSVLQPMHAEAIPVALDVPSDLEIIEAWQRMRKENGQPLPTATELLNFRRVIEKTTDYTDPPRFYPMIGMARMHHATYVCSVYTADNRLEVVYLDHSHLHPLGTVETYQGPSSLRQSTVQVRLETPAVNAPDQTMLLRFRIRNHSAQRLDKLSVMIELPPGFPLQEATSAGTLEADRITWDIGAIEAGREHVLELNGQVNAGLDGRLTVLVQVAGKNCSYGQFSLPSTKSGPPVRQPAADPFGR